MNRLEKIVATVMISLIPLFFGGCAPSETNESRTFYPQKHKAYGIPSSNLISIDDIAIENEESIKDSIDKTQNYIDYIGFKKNYSTYDSKLKPLLRKNQYKEFDRLAAEVGRRLRDDPNPYAQRYYEKVKNFSYEAIGYTQGHDKYTYSARFRVFPFIGKKERTF